MKRIKLIEELCLVAQTRARSTVRGYGIATRNRHGTAVYEVIVDRNKKTVALKHYGTVTIFYDYRDKVLLSWYGEGVSDRDSMNTFMTMLGEDRYTFRCGPVMGFIMEDENGVQHEPREGAELLRV